MTSNQIAQIESILQYTFTDKQLLTTAFTHSSYAKQSNVKDNERMEFLGDAILDMVVSEYLFGKFDDCEAGDLSTMRTNIVSAEALRSVVNDLNILQYLQVGNGASNIKTASEKIKSNLYEAIVAAIYQDSGFESAKEFVLRTLKSLLDEPSKVKHKDSKTILQEYCQGLKPQKTVTYVQAERAGTDNNPTYTIDLYIDNEYECSGQGSSKKSAEQDVAKKIVTKWRID